MVDGLIWATMVAVFLRRTILYCAFHETGERLSIFIAASMSWSIFRDLARAVLGSGRSLLTELERVLTLLRILAERTNPQRRSSFERLSIDPALDYG